MKHVTGQLRKDNHFLCQNFYIFSVKSDSFIFNKTFTTNSPNDIKIHSFSTNKEEFFLKTVVLLSPWIHTDF